MSRARVIVQIKNDGDDYLTSIIALLESQHGFNHDAGYGPIDMQNNSVVIRGNVEENVISALRKVPGVIGVFPDARIGQS